MGKEDKKDWKKFMKIGGNILVVVSLVFLVRRVYKMDIDYKTYFNLNKLLRLIPVIALFTVLMTIQFIPWRMIIYSMTGVKVPKMNTARVFTKSALMKYIPGNVFQYVGRTGLVTENQNLNILNIAASVIVESVALFSGAIIVGLVCAREYACSILLKNKVILVIATVIFWMICLCILFYKKKIVLFLERKNIKISFGVLVALTISIIFFAITLAIQGVLLTLVMNILSGDNYFYVSSIVCGAYCIGWVAGYITPGASGGIGIREAALCMLLQNVIPDKIIIIAVLIFRFINILGDLLAFGFIEFLTKILSHEWNTGTI